MPRGPGSTQQKIILLLLGGFALGLSRSPTQYFRIVRGMRREWQDIDERALRRSIASLYRSRIVSTQPAKEGSFTLILTDEGKRRALTYRIDTMQIKHPDKWDGKWRIVISDIPEKKKRVREALRVHLRNLQCYQLQKSVFVTPFDCRDEIDYIIEFYAIRQYVRFIIAESIDNELHLKKIFKLV
jgi:DNA-binding transcriptional regulator PaaX